MSKSCNKCKKEKAIEDFSTDTNNKDGRYPWCKKCVAERKRFYFKENKEIVAKNNKKYYKKSRYKILKKRKKYYTINREIILQKAKNRNPQKRREWENNARKNNLQYKLAKNLRSRLFAAIKGKYKQGSAISDLGCSIEQLRIYLESQFKLNMTWENYGKGKGKWSIDHIIALSTVDLTDREQFLKISHYTNLRPLWNKDQSRIYHKEQKNGS